MLRITVLLLCMIMVSCSDDGTKADSDKFGEAGFSEKFREVTIPFEISDTALLNNKDTATIRNAEFDSLLPDSLVTAVFGKGSVVKYTPLVKAQIEKEIYYLLKGSSGKKTVALLFVFDEKGSFGAAFPLLVPDSDPKTQQVSSIDKSKTIARSITKKLNEEDIQEGRDVYAYSAGTRSFSLIMSDVLDDDKLELINPIDTLTKTHAFAGDYRQGKKSLVSLRDGRNDKEIQFFIHFEKEGEDCMGELKGTALFTSTKTAVYRQGGDPCIMELQFSPTAVTLKEVEGCGAHRGLNCAFEGKFTRKKITPVTTAIKK